jgi:type I restriction enzyme S subunit
LATVPVEYPSFTSQERIVKLLDEADELRQLRAKADSRTHQLLPAQFQDMFGDPAINPKQWPLVQLGDIAPLKSGYAFKSSDYCRVGVRLVRISNLNGKTLEFGDGTAFLPESYWADYRAFQVAPKDILIAMSGATTGKLGMVRPADVPSLLNQRVGKFFIRSFDRLDPMFLFCLLSFEAMNRRLIGSAAGSAQANVSPSAVGRVEIPIPPLSLQREFAEWVMEIHDLEARQAASRRRMNELIKSLLQRAFNGDL